MTIQDLINESEKECELFWHKNYGNPHYQAVEDFLRDRQLKLIALIVEKLEGMGGDQDKINTIIDNQLAILPPEFVALSELEREIIKTVVSMTAKSVSKAVNDGWEGQKDALIKELKG